MYMLWKFQCNGIISVAVIGKYIAENKCKDIIKSLKCLGELLSLQLHPSASFFPLKKLLCLFIENTYFKELWMSRLEPTVEKPVRKSFYKFV